MGLKKRTNAGREAEIKNLLRKKYPNGIDKQIILNYAKVAARVLTEGKVPFSESNDRCWELYHYYEKDMYPNSSVEERTDTDSYRLMGDGRLVSKSTRELWFKIPDPAPYNFKSYEIIDHGTKEISPSEQDLIQIDLLLEENHINGVLEAFLIDGGKNYHLNQNDPSVVKRIQEQRERQAAEKNRKRQAAAAKAIKAGKTLLLVAAWIIFGFFIFRFVKGMLWARGELQMYASQYILLGSVSVGLLNFAQALRSANREGILKLTILSSVIICLFFAGAVYRYGNITQAYFWRQYLPLILRFIIFIIIGQILGSVIRSIGNK